MRRNYCRKLSGEIITENYQLVYQSWGKCEIYRDTGVSKNRDHRLFMWKNPTLCKDRLILVINDLWA